MTFHFKQDGGPISGTAFLDCYEYAKLRDCPQCDHRPAYGDDGSSPGWSGERPPATYYFVECPKCGLRIRGPAVNPASVRTLRNAVRYHRRALTAAVNNWNDRARQKGEAPWPKQKSEM